MNPSLARAVQILRARGEKISSTKVQRELANELQSQRVVKKKGLWSISSVTGAKSSARTIVNDAIKDGSLVLDVKPKYTQYKFEPPGKLARKAHTSGIKTYEPPE